MSTPTTSTAAAPLAQSRLAPFVITTRKLIPRLCVSTEGFDGTGKSHFALSMPKPMAYFILDRGFDNPDEDVRAQLGLDRVDMAVYRFNKAGADQASLMQDAQQTAWGPLKQDIRSALKSKKYRSIGIDTADEGWELLRMARYGRLEKIPPMQYAALNAEYRAAMINDFLKDADNLGINVCWVHKMKAEYKNKVIRKANGEESEVGEKTGRFIRAGFGAFQYDAPNRIAHLKDLTCAVGEGRFKIRVDKCINASLEGQTIPELDFPGLASMVFPQVDPSHWE